MAGNAASKFQLTYGFTNPLTTDSVISNTVKFGDRNYYASFANGTSSGQIEVAYADHRVAPTGSIVYDLAALPDSQSVATVLKLTFEVVSPPGSGATLSVQTSAPGGWTAGIPADFTLGPKGLWVLCQPDLAIAPVVNPGTNHLITVVGPRRRGRVRHDDGRAGLTAPRSRKYDNRCNFTRNRPHGHPEEPI